MNEQIIKPQTAKIYAILELTVLTVVHARFITVE